MTERPAADGPYEPSDYAEMLGIEQVATGEGWARYRMPVRRRHLQTAGNVQGGLIAALADQALAGALHTLLPEGHSTVTAELKVNFISPVRQGELVAEGRILSKGGTLAVGEATVTSGEGNLVAKGLGTWRIFGPRA